MTRLFRSKSCGLVGITDFNSTPPSPLFHQRNKNDDEEEEEDDDDDDEEEEEEEEEALESEDDTGNPISTPFISPGNREGQSSNLASTRHQNSNQFQILDILVAALRKSLVTCSVEREDVASMDISWPTEVRHVSHVTFDRFNGFLGLPTELEHEVPTKAPSARSVGLALKFNNFR